MVQLRSVLLCIASSIAVVSAAPCIQPESAAPAPKPSATSYVPPAPVPAPSASPVYGPSSVMVPTLVPATTTATLTTTASTTEAPAEPTTSSQAAPAPAPQPEASTSSDPATEPLPLPTTSSEPAPAPQPQPEPTTSSDPAPAPQPQPQPTTNVPEPVVPPVTVAPPQPTPPPPTQADDTKITARDRQDLLDLHNNYRQANGVSQQVTYSDRVAAQAAVRAAKLAANGCNLVHGDLEGVGQNLSMEAATNPVDLPMKDLFDGWASETHAENEYNHATQVLWATTKEIGCAKAMGTGAFDGRFPYCEVLVCDYYPAGNMVGSSWKTGN
ncbi:CAP domain-containing protein [Chytriomyces sp. MP71]|nr:CAP domain-containing protein [Chytriomyces sp. MP71]